MRLIASLAVLAAALLAGCGESAAPTAAATEPTSFPATVEGDLFFDLGEASDSGTIAPGETTVVALDVDGSDSNDGLGLQLQVTGAQLAGLTGEGERVRATLSGKGQWNEIEVYQVSALQKL